MLTRSRLETHLTWVFQVGALAVALVLGRATDGAGPAVIVLALVVVAARSLARRILERVLPDLVKTNLIDRAGDELDRPTPSGLIRSYGDLWRTWKLERAPRSKDV